MSRSADGYKIAMRSGRTAGTSMSQKLLALILDTGKKHEAHINRFERQLGSTIEIHRVIQTVISASSNPPPERCETTDNSSPPRYCS
jgi:hypothetical protein